MQQVSGTRHQSGKPPPAPNPKLMTPSCVVPAEQLSTATASDLRLHKSKCCFPSTYVGCGYGIFTVGSRHATTSTEGDRSAAYIPRASRQS